MSMRSGRSARRCFACEYYPARTATALANALPPCPPAHVTARTPSWASLPCFSPRSGSRVVPRLHPAGRALPRPRGFGEAFLRRPAFLPRFDKRKPGPAFRLALLPSTRSLRRGPRRPSPSCRWTAAKPRRARWSSRSRPGTPRRCRTSSSCPRTPCSRRRTTAFAAPTPQPGRLKYNLEKRCLTVA